MTFVGDTEVSQDGLLDPRCPISVSFLLVCFGETKTRSSRREVTIRVPFLLQSILVGKPSPKKGDSRAPSWGT